MSATVRRHFLAALAVVAITAAAVLGVALTTGPSHATSGPAIAGQVATGADAQLADDLTAACKAHPGACRHTPTAANVATAFVPWVCAWSAQPTPPAGTSTAAWRAAWPSISTTVVDAGRCTQPGDTQLAAEIDALQGGHPALAAAGVPVLLGHACPELTAGVPTHTVYAGQVLRVVSASGRCPR